MNSVGSGALIRAVGSDVVADNDFTLITEGLPAGEFSLYFFGDAQVNVPTADGIRCVGGNLERFNPAVLINGAGVSTLAVDLTAPPAAGMIMAGANLNFQLWYRDGAGGGSGSNFSNALNVVWQ